MLTAGCGAGLTPPGPVGETPCYVAGEAGFRDTVTIAFTDVLHPAHQPVPLNDAERLLFRHQYATLIRLDCQGRATPDAAVTWSRDSTGYSWSFTLDSLALSGGAPRNAADMVTGWDSRRTEGLWPWRRILSVRATGRYSIEIRLDSIFGTVPEVFADLALAIHHPAPPGRTPPPSGRFREFLHARPTTGPILDLILLVPADTPARSPVLRFQGLRRGLDPRDLLDLPAVGALRPADFVITRDADAVAYAGARAGFRTIPLAWDRSYLLVSPLALDALDGIESPDFRESLARETLRDEARPPAPPFTWNSQDCSTRPLRPMGRLSQVVYPLDDDVARQLAERLVALRFPAYRALGLLPDPLAASLAAGEAALYVVPVNRTPAAGCHGFPASPAGSRVIPLVDSRAHAIVRDGVPPFYIEADGSVRFPVAP